MVRNWSALLAASALLALYVWTFAVLATLPVFVALNMSWDYWMGTGAFAVIGATMAIWAILLLFPMFFWIVGLLLVDRLGMSKSWWQQVTLSGIAGGLGLVAYILLSLLILRDSDGLADGFYFLGALVPLACILAFPIFALLFKRYHRAFRLSVLFKEDAGG